MEEVHKLLGSFKDSSAAAKTAIVLIWVCAVIAVVDMKAIEFYTIAQQDYLVGYPPSAPVGLLNLPYSYYMTFAVILTVLLLILLVLAIEHFMRWLYSANLKCRQLGVELEDAPGWAVGWWFIPVANAIMPYVVLATMWDKLDSAISHCDMRTSKWIMVWWVSLLTFFLLLNWRIVAIHFLHLDIVSLLDRSYLDNFFLFGKLGVALWFHYLILRFEDKLGQLSQIQDDVSTVTTPAIQ